MAADGPAAPESPAVPTAGLSIDQLTAQLVARAAEVVAAQDRVGRLLEANRAVVGELSLPIVLRRVVEAARELVGARYRRSG